jgi:hypothetical protein
MSYSKNLFIAATEFYNFETSLARVLKQPILNHMKEKTIISTSFFQCG